MPAVRIGQCLNLGFGRLLVGSVLSVGLAFFAVPARAQSYQEQGSAQEGPNGQGAADHWIVNLGVGALDMPTYPGASTHSVRPVPFVNISYGHLLVIGPDGVEVNLVDEDGLRIGPVIGFQRGRDQSDDSRLNGLGNISPSMTAGIFVDYRTGPFDLVGTVNQAIPDTNYGLLARVRGDYRIQIIRKGIEFNIGPDVEFADASYNQTWFGVSQVQSAQSGLSAYSPGAGIKDVGLHAGLTAFVSQHILVRLFGTIERLTGNDAGSPIVQNKTQTSIGLGAAYHF